MEQRIWDRLHVPQQPTYPAAMGEVSNVETSCSSSSNSSSSNSAALLSHLHERRALGESLFQSRRQREFIPEERKDGAYWDRRRRNNQAAKRSREKRRINDIMLEARLEELERDNAALRARLAKVQAELYRATAGGMGERLPLPSDLPQAPPLGQQRHPRDVDSPSPTLPPSSPSPLCQLPGTLNQGGNNPFPAANYPPPPPSAAPLNLSCSSSSSLSPPPPAAERTFSSSYESDGSRLSSASTSSAEMLPSPQLSQHTSCTSSPRNGSSDSTSPYQNQLVPPRFPDSCYSSSQQVYQTQETPLSFPTTAVDLGTRKQGGSECPKKEVED